MARLVRIPVRRRRMALRDLRRYYHVPPANRPPLREYLQRVRREIIVDDRPNRGYRHLPILDYRGVTANLWNTYMTMAWVGPHGMVGDTWVSGSYTPIWWPWPDEPPQSVSGYPLRIEAGLVRPSFRVERPWAGSVAGTISAGREELRAVMFTHIQDYVRWYASMPWIPP